MKKKTDNRKALISKDAAWKVVDGEAVIINKKNGWYYSLDKTGTEIWLLFAKKKSISAIAAAISAEYGITESAATRDIMALIKNLSKEKLVLLKY
jgi:hypothetical protein